MYMYDVVKLTLKFRNLNFRTK